MSYSLPKYYFRYIPAYVMEEIITGMIDARRDGGVAYRRA
jgi:hypothetical protein